MYITKNPLGINPQGVFRTKTKTNFILFNLNCFIFYTGFNSSF